ncbi:DUF4105 domain-containing protein [Alcanivorax sp. DP30]|uniref:lipoprotein N-acyltransferase Lnb domain-containing protein n=1 Tax=Alcanivorax sp. DP30 TaxID=2606217 RepID=UPI001370FD23|nr:DUF4105 domain-containing protein [Alcanivorax sp. DP30]MZR63580.1 DUF4105 domain-containing protein [Alcanivorax sp. DP30]
MMQKKSWALILSVALLLGYGIWFHSRVPVQDADWKEKYAVTPEVTLHGDTLHINGIRDFRFDSDGQVVQARYLNRTYTLSKLKGLWFGLSHFGGDGLAHAFASFEFSDGTFLAVSIEARLRKEQNRYNPLAGAFRNYTKMVVLGTEQDVIGSRAFSAQEPVFLYPINGSALQGQALLLNFLRRADILSRTPDFYNTLTDNCLTGLLAESGRYTELHDWLDYRLLLPGYSHEVLYEHGLIGQGESLEQIQAQARVNPDIAPDTDNYSQKIRSAPSL